MSTIEILSNELVGNFISRFGIGDTWNLFIGNCCLMAREIVSEDEKFLNQWYKNNYPSFGNCVDQINISKSTIVAAHLRKEIKRIEFEGDSELLIPANVDIVDWQWCLNTTGKDPYANFLVACFFAGEIEIKDGQ
jgi:hypothetical protein